MNTSTHTSSCSQRFDPDFPFSEEVFLSSAPMTDEEFKEFVKSKNNEVPIEEVDFTDPLGI